MGGGYCSLQPLNYYLAYLKILSMKKIYFALLFVFCIAFNPCKAQQYVTIPDATFATWLHNNGFGGCMNGNQLDTTCAAVLDSTVLNCTGIPIKNLSGVQYFKSLLVLNCANDSVNSIPAFPASLNGVNCQNNFLSSLPVLPPAMQFVFCNNNQFISLPTLPQSLRYLFCDNNKITSLPTLPDSMLILSCNNNQLTTLPALHDSLNTLLCALNHLNGLPALPASLTTLSCNNNPLNNLPALPGALTSLTCNNDQLTSLPALPVGLNSLVCNNNSLTSIPALPDSLFTFNCSNNPNLTCLPELKKIVFLQFTNTLVTCIPNFVVTTFSNPSITGLPICGIFDTTTCKSPRKIGGRVYFDQNNNCTYDGLDLATPLVKTQLFRNGVLERQAYTGNTGLYSFSKIDNGNYTLQLDTSVFPFTVSCPDSGHIGVAITSVDSFSNNNNFGFKCNPHGFDLGVLSAVNYGGGTPKPGAAVNFNIIAGDMSALYGQHCAAGISGKVQVIFNGPITFTSVAFGALNPSSVSGDTITWNIANFGNVNNYGDFNLLFQINNNAVPGTQACFTINITPNSGDFNTSNNTFNYCFTVVSSMAGNEKEVSPKNYVGNTNDWITYTIRFQNTTGSTITNARVTDLLDNNIDPSSFQLISTSAVVVTQVYGNMIEFSFPNANLVDSSSNVLGSRGYVQFKVKMRSGLPPGTQVLNNSSVYFDQHAAITTNTTVNTLCSTINTSVSRSIACGDSTKFNGQYYHYSGSYPTVYQTGIGCDSIVTLFLSVVGDSINQQANMCLGDSVYFNGFYIRVPGYYSAVLPGHNACDTFISMNIIGINPLDTVFVFDTICAGGNVPFNGGFADSTGAYIAHLTSQFGCDSIIVLQLYERSQQITPFSNSICYGDTFNFYGYQLTTPNTYAVSFTNMFGCDSVISLTLTVYDTVPSTHIFDTICPGDSVAFNGTYAHTTGTYFKHLGSNHGCDSLIVLALTVRELQITNISNTICAGDTFTFYDRKLTSTNFYYDTLTNVIGCDSVIALNLIVRAPIPVTHIFDTICQGAQVAFNNGFVDTTGTYTALLSSEHSCDSTVILKLTVKPLPVVHFSWQSMVTQGYLIISSLDTAECIDQTPVVPLFGGTPNGGTYTGFGVFQNAIYADSFIVHNHFGPDTITYTVTTNGCSTNATNILLAEVCEGVDKINADNLFTIYPNPAKDYVIVETDLSAIGGWLQLTDVTGRIISKLKIENAKFRIATNNLTGGVYFITLNNSAGKIATRKLVVE